MKQLYLIRHAKAIPADAGVDDFKRPLTKRGCHDANTMSKQLKNTGILPDLLVSSPADRAIETAHIFAERFDYPLQNTLLHNGIYDGPEETLTEIIHHFDDACDTVFLFGHEPTLSGVAHRFLQNFASELRTGGVIGIAFEVSHWQDIGAGTGKLVLSDAPIQRGIP